MYVCNSRVCVCVCVCVVMDVRVRVFILCVCVCVCTSARPPLALVMLVVGALFERMRTLSVARE